MTPVTAGVVASSRVRLRLLLLLALVTPLGLATKLYTGPAAEWVHNSAGGLLYEIFWVLAILWLRPGLSPWPVALGVLLATCALELLQLWHPPALEALRHTFLGQALLGSQFSLWDFPYYGVGCLAGVGLARRAGAGRAPAAS